MISYRLTRHIPLFGVTIAFGRGFGAVNVDHRAHFGAIRFGSVEGVVDGEEVVFGELVGPFDGDGIAATDFECGTGEAAGVSPEAGGWKVAMQFDEDFAHGQAVTIPFAGGARDRGNGQRIGELRQSAGVEGD